MKKCLIYDTTLREGSQSPGISPSVSDKLRIALELDALGVSFIEGGIPGSNPKEDEFYRRAGELKLKHSRIVPFGRTLLPGKTPETDELLKALAETPFEYVCVFAKTDPDVVRGVLRIDPASNISLIVRTLEYLKAAGKTVIFDCEHYFRCALSGSGYAIECIKAAAQAGASYIVLCDTTGAADPELTAREVKKVRRLLNDLPGIGVGVHMHNDGGMADANTYSGAAAGAELINTTLFGLGERSGGADFFTTVPNLELKLGRRCLKKGKLTELTRESYLLAELLNIKPYAGAPYVGRNAFAHKAGTHIDAVKKSPGSYECVPPESVGNTRRFLTSEYTGRSGMRTKVEEILGNTDDELCERILSELKQKEFEGYQYESAEASLELMVRKLAGTYEPAFSLNSYKVITLDEKAYSEFSASAIVDMKVDGVSEITAGNGIGPVDALDHAFHRAMGHFYPATGELKLTDYRVRVIDSGSGTASKVRVFVEFTAGGKSFGTVGVSGDIIQASWSALVDAYEYWIMRGREAGLC